MYLGTDGRLFTRTSHGSWFTYSVRNHDADTAARGVPLSSNAWPTLGNRSSTMDLLTRHQSNRPYEGKKKLEIERNSPLRYELCVVKRATHGFVKLSFEPLEAAVQLRL